MNPSVCVVIVNWNGWQDTIECLESVFRLESKGFQVVVCDNGSLDDSLTRIQAWADGRLDALPTTRSPLVRDHYFPSVTKPVSCSVLDRNQAETGKGTNGIHCQLVLVDIGENLGFAGGNNVGLRFVLNRGFKYVWLLNNDTVVDPQALNALFERMEEAPRAGICGSTLLHYHRPDRVQALGGAYYCKWIGLPWHLGRLKKASDPVNRTKVERGMDYVIGASMFVRREFIEKVGLLCEDYFLFYEEVDWMVRAKQQYSLAFAADSVVYHKVGATIGTSSNPAKKSEICDYYSIRNRFVFTEKYYPYALPTVYLGVFAALFSRMLIGQWKRVRMITGLMLSCGKRKLSFYE